MRGDDNIEKPVVVQIEQAHAVVLARFRMSQRLAREQVLIDPFEGDLEFLGPKLALDLGQVIAEGARRGAFGQRDAQPDKLDVLRAYIASGSIAGAAHELKRLEHCRRIAPRLSPPGATKRAENLERIEVKWTERFERQDERMRIYPAPAAAAACSCPPG